MTGSTDPNGDDLSDDQPPVWGTTSFSRLKNRGLLPEPEPEISTPPASFTPATSDLDAQTAEFGDVLHATINRASGVGCSAEQWADECRRVSHQRNVSMAVRQRAIGVIQSVGPKLDSMGTVTATEVPFSFMFNRWVLEGQIDAVITMDDATTIVDFKTGELSNIHPFQLKLYLLACIMDSDLPEEVPACPTQAQFLFISREGQLETASITMNTASQDYDDLKAKLRKSLSSLENPNERFAMFSDELDT